MAAKVAAARKARRHLQIVARTDAVASEGLEAAIARARLYVEAGADAIFPEALGDAAAFKRFSSEIKVPLLANMTEFGKTPFMTAAEFEALGYRMVIWPVSALRVAAKAQEELYAVLARSGEARSMADRMQTRAELYATIGYHAFEALDESISRSLIPDGNPD
jgi:methylisocitrate lyase